MNEKEGLRFSFAKSCLIDIPFGKENEIGSGIQISFDQIYIQMIETIKLTLYLGNNIC